MVNRETLALAGATVLTGIGVLVVPSWHNTPCHRAVIASVIVLGLLFVTRFTNAVRFEQYLLAGFLAAMPLVYLSAWYETSVLKSPVHLWLEAAGLAVFLALALLGLKKPAFLIAGIALHGVVWDLVHFRGYDYVPSWYAIDCLIVDVGIAWYAATRTQGWIDRQVTDSMQTTRV
jgi:hypothetical protein